MDNRIEAPPKDLITQALFSDCLNNEAVIHESNLMHNVCKAIV